MLYSESYENSCEILKDYVNPFIPEYIFLNMNFVEKYLRLRVNQLKYMY